MVQSNLPIAAFRDRILFTVANNPITIITAETGAGKSTQVPQYLLEEGYEVVVTQPRRLAARTLAERVAEEVGCELGDLVGYETAQEHIVSEQTQCRFVTDGLQLVHDLLQQKTSSSSRVLVLDEVHEWNLNIEVLVAWVKLHLEKGEKLKVVLMSATIDSEKLSEFFNNAPIVSVPGRLFPVEVKTSDVDIIDTIVSLVSKQHNVLVFQPGKAEIDETIEKLKQKTLNAEILPLHAELISDDQKLCFKHYGRPKVIVSTNVAQTSVTIDDIDAVVDSGMERRVELVDGVEGLYLRPISLSDSKQRKGRAGRTKPGVYFDFCIKEGRLEFPKAEIERCRLDQTVLRLAELGFDMEALSFFHQPDITAIQDSKKSLKILGCVDSDGSITPIGRKIARFPISVAYGRMIVEAEKLGVVKDILTIAALLETGDLHMRKTPEGYENLAWRNHIDREQDSDIIAQLNLFKNAENMKRDEMLEAGIRIKAFYRVKEIRQNLERSLRRYIKDIESEGSKTDVLKAVCAGMLPNLYRNTYGSFYGENDIIGRTIDKGTVTRGIGRLAVGFPFDLEIMDRFKRPKTLRILRMVSKVEPEWLIELAPHLLSQQKGIEPRYSSEHRDIVSTTTTLFNNIVIHNEEVLDSDHPSANEILKKRCYSLFLTPVLPTIDLNDSNCVVPEVLVCEAGKHPKTGEILYYYGTYRQSLLFASRYSAREVWKQTKEEAEESRTQLIEFLSRTHGRPERHFSKPKNDVVVTAVSSNERLKSKLADLQAKFAK